MLGFDWAPGNLTEPEGMKAGWQQRATTVTRLISLGQCTQHAEFFFFFAHGHTHINTSTFDCPPHTDNGQRFVIIRQEAPTVQLNQL